MKQTTKLSRIPDGITRVQKKANADAKATYEKAVETTRQKCSAQSWKWRNQATQCRRKSWIQVKVAKYEQILPNIKELAGVSNKLKAYEDEQAQIKAAC